jgi:hypothetical protein
MFYLSNAANAILEAAGEQLAPTEFGYRFQSLVVEALKLQPDWDGLYDNRGAGQPDCYFNSYGFEIKCRQTNPMPLDENGWNAMREYNYPRLIAMLSVSAPYPLWVADLSGLSPKPVKLNHDTAVDSDLEQHMQRALSPLIEAVGTPGLTAGSRQQVIDWVGKCRHCVGGRDGRPEESR